MDLPGGKEAKVMRKIKPTVCALLALSLGSFLAVYPQDKQAEEHARDRQAEEVAPSIPLEEEEKEAPPSDVTVEDLGEGHYRIRHIEVDKRLKRFAVPGRILRDEPPLEFLAVTAGAFKGYEALVELDANAYEFNTACILIGLDPDNGKPPRVHFDPEPTQGDPVEIWISWDANGETIRLHAADLVRLGEKRLPRSDWAYTGSIVTPHGDYMAHLDGTLIGFVHDPASVIEHRAGFGIKQWGSVGPDRSLMPPVGTPLTLTVERRKE